MNTKTTLRAPRFRVAALIAGLMVLAGCARQPANDAAFDTPEAAVSALVAALQKDDLAALQSLLGPGSEELLHSGDAVQDAGDRAEFLAAYQAKHALTDDGPDRKVLVTGDDEWPMPVPIVRRDGRWQFDGEAGIDEMIYRRVGGNELGAIDVCRGFVAAQLEYASEGRDGDPAGIYALKLVSDPGLQNGLYWEVAEGEPPSPAGPFVAAAAAEGYRASAERSPYHGYYYRMLYAQGENANGGARDYFRDGLLTEGFALVAWPADYGSSGVQTFIVNQDGIVFQKDLGEDTATAVEAIQSFDPDSSWTAIVPPEEPAAVSAAPDTGAASKDYRVAVQWRPTVTAPILQRMTPSEALVETLVANGVTEVFGIVGSAYMDALDIFPAAGIRFIPVAHEQGAAHMADGYARSSGRHGVCIAQNGPGITNFVTAIAAAYWAHSPVVFITPETGSTTLGLGGFQETEQLPIFSKITKYQGHVNNPKRMAEIAARCFDRAMLEMGPVQLNIPRDYFYGDIQAAISPPMRIGRGPGDTAALDEAAALLAQARFPVIVAGGGVIMSGGTAEAIALAERLYAPVANSYLHNDSFPASHSLWCGPLGYQGSKAAMKLIAQADVVLALGTRLGPFGTLPQYGMDYWPANAKIIQVDADPRVLGLVKPISVGINGDARAAAAALIERLAGRDVGCLANAGERKKRIASAKAAWEQELTAWTHERDPFSLEVAKDSKYMHPRQMLRALETAMPKHAMVSTDIGNICSVSNSYLRFDEPRSMFAAMSFGNCGYAFPVICGAKVACPERPAIAYVGDGAWGISLNELLTCAREKIGVTVVVFNNGQWGAEKKNHVDFYSQRFQAVNLTNPSWAKVARAFGCEGVTVDRLPDVGPALQASVAAQADGKCTVIEMMVTQELGDPFRRDALSKPVRYLEKYKAYT